MIKLLLLAVVPFITEHRNVTPKTEVSTNFYGSVTGIVDNAYIQAHGGGGGGGVDTNAVRDIAREEIVQATNSLNQTLSDALDDKRDKDDLAAYKMVGVGTSCTWASENDYLLKTYLKGEHVTLRYEESQNEWWPNPNYSTKSGWLVTDGVEGGGPDAVSITFKFENTDTGDFAYATATRAHEFRPIPDRLATTNGVNAAVSSKMDKVITPSRGFLIADENGNAKPSMMVDEITIGEIQNSLSTKADRATTLSGYGITDAAPLSMISETDTTFSNAVLSVGLNIDTNSVAVLNNIAETFGGFPIEGTATTVGGLLAALAAAVAWLKKNKVGSFEAVGGASATVENGVAKLDDFFTESNSLLNGRLAYSRNATGLKDRAFNTLSFDGTEYNLSTALAAVTPTASGQPRDLLIVATATAATTISFTAGTIKGDKPTIDGSGTWLITLTEYASGVWYCRQIKMEDAA